MTRTSGSVPEEPQQHSATLGRALPPLRRPRPAQRVGVRPGLVHAGDVDQHLRHPLHGTGQLRQRLAAWLPSGPPPGVRSGRRPRWCRGRRGSRVRTARRRSCRTPARISSSTYRSPTLAWTTVSPASFMAVRNPRLLMTVATTVSRASTPCACIGEGEDRHDLVAVDQVALVVGGETPVRVAVEGEARVRPVLHDGALEGREMRRTAVVVDVEPVRQSRGSRPPRAPAAANACGATTDAAPSAQSSTTVGPRVTGRVANEVVDVLLASVGRVSHPADVGAVGPVRGLDAEQRLDLRPRPSRRACVRHGRRT